VTVEFRPMAAGDLPLVHEWLQREHVRRWWTDRETYEEVVEHYLPSIEGSQPTDLYLIVLDKQPIGFIQTYKVSDYPEYREDVQVEDGVAGVDLFIADPELVGRGIGSQALLQFVDDIVFTDGNVHACIADPDVENVASLRAFEKAGFLRVRRFVDRGDGRPHTLVRRDRYGESRSTTQPSPSRR
jgi:RimJ/RimL family protein N-acetyltransferase